MRECDYLIVGSGLYGATFAHFARKAGKRCLVIDKRPQLGGNLYCENVKGINVHKYGAHIFHTSNKDVWDFVNSIVPFNRYTNSPIANYKGQLYNLPFNMNTFNRMWGVCYLTLIVNALAYALLPLLCLLVLFLLGKPVSVLSKIFFGAISAIAFALAFFHLMGPLKLLAVVFVLCFVGVCLVGMLMFKKKERTFIDTI